MATDLRPPGTASTPDRVRYFDQLAPQRAHWVSRNQYYYDQLAKLFTFHIPPGSSVLEIGCGTGHLLEALRPARGVGLDSSPGMIAEAKHAFPGLEFRVDDVERLETNEKFDYVVVSDVIGLLHDVQQSLKNLQQVCTPRTRIVISYYNFMWEPLLRFGQRLGWMNPMPWQNWLSNADIENLLKLAGFEVIRSNSRLLLPKCVPLLAPLCNRILVNLPVFRSLGLVKLLIARPKPDRAGVQVSSFSVQVSPNNPSSQPLSTPSNTPPLHCSTTPPLPSVSVVIPARNERGNIEAAVQRTPHMGAHTELVFVEGNSSDDTAAEIQRVIAAHPERDLKFIPQGAGRGKGDAVRKGFAAAKGDILMILDADLTVEPEELPKFYDALVSGHGEFIHGSRLVYPMDKQAMRFLNMLGNKFFSLAFSYLLDQRFKDTLCGTKVLYRSEYDKIAANRHYFGDFDPFGDFDLIFGAAKLNLKIVEIPIHYRERTYGTTNISRFRHGWLLLRMCFFAMRKIKFV